jgi:ACS family hexuronate transporter-like MFS transporter
LGWRWAFIVTGAVGFVWLIFWLLLYHKPEEHPRISRAELDYIRSDPQPPAEKIPWVKLLPHRQTWAFGAGKFLIDPVWWFYLFWVPGFLQSQHGLSLAQIGVPLMVIYIIADIGSVAGGWMSSTMIKRGASVNAARKTTMLVCAVIVLPVVLAPHVQGMWTAVLIIGLATAAHQGFSCNLFTLTSDMFPSRAVGSVVGIGGMAGAAGGMAIALLVGPVLQHSHSYTIPFVIAGSAYLVALAVIHLLSPKLAPVQMGHS